MTDEDILRGQLRVIAHYSGSDAGECALREVIAHAAERRAQLEATQADRHAILLRAEAAEAERDRALAAARMLRRDLLATCISLDDWDSVMATAWIDEVTGT